MTPRPWPDVPHAATTAWRRDPLAHPGTGIGEHRTGDLLAARSESRGIAGHRSLGGIPVAGVLRTRRSSGGGSRRFELRADTDARRRGA